jgi:hypothetical protein
VVGAAPPVLSLEPPQAAATRPTMTRSRSLVETGERMMSSRGLVEWWPPA